LSITYRRFQKGDEEHIVELLKLAFPRLKNEDLWHWKYTLNPSFDASLLVVAEKDGKTIIGTNYWLERTLKLSGNLQVKAVLGADVAVDPAYQGAGIGSELMRYPRMSGVFKEHETLVSYMFGRPELSKRFYRPVGYIVGSSDTITYRKLFNCRQLKAKFEEINQTIKGNEELRKRLSGLALCLSFRVKGAPDFSLHIEHDKVYLTEGLADKPDVVIEGILPLSSLVVSGAAGTDSLVKALLTGKFKVRKGLLKIFKVRQVFKIFQAALKIKS
jgi:predicted N-acetyltransferase YhbS/putative sterol carrier protein